MSVSHGGGVFNTRTMRRDDPQTRALIELNREVIRAMKEPVVLERFKALAVNLAEPMTPEQFTAYVLAQYARYAKLLPELHIGQ